MSLALSLLFLLSAVAIQDPEPARPHATLPVRNPGNFGWPSLDEWGGWQRLRPSWLDEERTPLLTEASRQAMAAFAGARNGWDPGTIQRWLDATRPRPLMLQYRLTREPEGTLLLAGAESVMPGRAAVFSSLVRRPAVLDLRSQIACDSAIGQPVVGEQVAGVSLALELLPVPGMGWQAELALALSRFGPRESIPMGDPILGGKDRLHQDYEECGCTALLTAGAPVTLILPAAAGSTLRLELALTGEDPPVSRAIGGAMIATAAPTLAARPDWPAFVGTLERAGEMWSSREGYLAFAAEQGGSQADVVRERAAEEARVLRCTLEVSLEGADPPQRASLEATLVAGEPVRFASGHVFDALVSWSAEVAQSSRMADPEFEPIHSGCEGTILAGIEGDRPGPVELDLVLRAAELGEPGELLLAPEEQIGQPGATQFVTRPRVRVAIERPEVSEVTVRGVFLPDENGRVLIERAAGRLLGREGKLRVLLTVRLTD